MRVADFEFYLPPDLIAQTPVEPRDASRLLVMDRDSGRMEHRLFSDIVSFLQPADVLVINNTRVFPARLSGRNQATGAKVEATLLAGTGANCWEALVRPGRKARPGHRLIFGDGELTADVTAITPIGGRVLQFWNGGDLTEIFNRIGKLPLPPYIKQEPEEPERYQTVYSANSGSVAAPTAGLHFTPRLLAEIRGCGVEIVELLLHVGIGTFRPVKTEKVEDHRMHAEYYHLDEGGSAVINQRRQAGGKVIAVGTTTARTLETLCDADGSIHPGSGWTDIFIFPGYQFRAVDGLITNFHLPRSTLLMLVSAFAGRERIMAAYQEAVARRYRFFSFGDVMLII